MFRVSVIIPVYNGAKFIEEAVGSAIDLPEVGEIILVEDGSKDESLIICKLLARTYSKIKFLQHPCKGNRGVSKSRNLGIKNAKFDYIAFLDADDLFLPNRFFRDKELFEHNTEVKISYSLSIILFKSGKKEYFGTTIDVSNEGFCSKNVNCIYKKVLIDQLILGHVSSTTFRKDIFKDNYFFDYRLSLHEDTELWNKFCRKYIFYGSELNEYVSIARRHTNNTISKKSILSIIKFIYIYFDNIGIKNIFDFEKKYAINQIGRSFSNYIKPNFLRRIIFKFWTSFLYLFKDGYINAFMFLGKMFIK